MKKLSLCLLSFTLACLGNACSDDSTTDSSSGSTSSSGGASSSSGGASSSSGGSGVNKCPPQGTSDCPQAEIEAYQKCATEKCDADYKACYGDGYASGNWGGPCGEQITCSTACECNDSECQQKCLPDQTCTSCLTKLGQCIVNSCTLPACAGGGGGGGGGGKTCADLQACCGKIADATKKSQCDAQYSQLQSLGDVACGAAYAGFAADCP